MTTTDLLQPLDDTRPSSVLDNISDFKALVRLLTSHVIELQRRVAALERERAG